MPILYHSWKLCANRTSVLILLPHGPPPGISPGISPGWSLRDREGLRQRPVLKVTQYVRILSQALNSGLLDPRLCTDYPGCHGALAIFPDQFPDDNPRPSKVPGTPLVYRETGNWDGSPSLASSSWHIPFSPTVIKAQLKHHPRPPSVSPPNPPFSSSQCPCPAHLNWYLDSGWLSPFL